MEGIQAQAGDRLIVRSTTSSTQVVEVSARFRLESGGLERHTLRVTGDGLIVTAIAEGPRTLREMGTCVSMTARVLPSATAVLPGAWYLEVAMGSSPSDRVILGQGYVSDGQALSLGDSVAPGTGPGVLEWLTGGADLIGTVNGAYGVGPPSAGQIQVTHGFIVYYNASADVATRTIIPDVEALGGAVPTGFAGAGTNWTGPTLTLTASEEGVYTVLPGMLSINDNGTLTYANTTTAPHPFPLASQRGSYLAAILAIVVGSGSANDRWSWYILRETWVMPSAV